MKAILLADDHHRNYHAGDFFTVYSDTVLEKLQSLTELELQPVYLREFPQKQELLKETELILSNWGMPELTYEQIRQFMPRVKAVFYAGGSVEPFGGPYYRLGARIFTSGHANAVPAAEYTAAQIVLALKGVQRACRSYHDEASYAEARRIISGRTGNYQARVGVIGVGRVGRRVCRLLQNYDLQVFGCDPYLTPDRAKELGITIMDQDEMFATCDVVTCHILSREHNLHQIGYSLLSQLGDNAVFINAAQGDVVDQEALIRAMKEKPGRTTILDSTEPMPLPEGHPLLTMDNVFITPHIAGSFGGELERMGMHVVEAVEDYLAGRPSRHEALNPGL